MALICDAALDAALQYIIDNVSHLHILSADPGSTWSNIASYTLGNGALVSGDFSSLGDYSGGGRQAVVPEKTISVNGDGTVTYVALVDTTGTEILAVSNTVAEVVTNGGNLLVPTWLIFVEDAVNG